MLVNQFSMLFVFLSLSSPLIVSGSYFFRFFNCGKPLSNSDIDKLIDFATNLFKLGADRFKLFEFRSVCVEFCGFDDVAVCFAVVALLHQKR